MNKILVPLDFSGSSEWGFYYAYQLAQQFGTDLYLVHIFRPPYIDSSMPPEMIQQIISEKKKLLLDHLKNNSQVPLFLKNNDMSDSVKIHYIIESTSNTTISEIAQKNEVDLVVMGTHGAGYALEKVWGTTTAKVIEEVKCPVLAIPIGVEFSHVDNIAYATDFDTNDLDNIMQLVLFATAINAKVHCVHINNFLDPIDRNKEAIFKAKFEERFKDFPVTFSSRSSTSVEEGLETFVRINHIDILSMLTHKRNLWNRMFGEKSITREMTLRSKTPLLAFHS